MFYWRSQQKNFVLITEFLLEYKGIEQQRKDIEDFFLQIKYKLNEQIVNVKQLLVQALNATQFIKDEKLKQEEPEKKDDKKETKKDDKKQTKKYDKNDTKKDDKKEEKKDPNKVGINKFSKSHNRREMRFNTNY